MGTYGNLRPCNFASDKLVDISPLKEDVCKGTDFVVVRELTGGIYFGERKEDDGDGTAWDTEPYSRPEIERITRLAAYLALKNDPPSKVWSLDKANVLATSRLWRRVFTEVMEKEFPQLTFGHHLIDSAAMLMVRDPRALNGVVVTSNLFGDIISDEASVIPGSIGLLPSASLSGIPDGEGRCNGIYEPIHGMSLFIYPQTRFLHVEITQKTRIRTRHLRPRNRQPHRHHSFRGHDAEILPQPPSRSHRSRGGSTEDNRSWSANKRYRWKGSYEICFHHRDG
jgi:3-isopropylmalate dehydrogenase